MKNFNWFNFSFSKDTANVKQFFFQFLIPLNLEMKLISFSFGSKFKDIALELILSIFITRARTALRILK